MKKIIFGLTVLSISLNAQSAPIPPKPNHCPSMQAIQSLGFDLVQKDDTNSWSIWKLKAAYNTNATWDLGIGVSAKNSSEAAAKAKLALSLVEQLDGPELSDDQSYWLCYQFVTDNNGDFYAVTTSTPGQHGKLSMIKR